MEDPEAAPLLQRVDYESCPGCLLERRKLQQKGAPKKELIFVAILVLCNSLPISSLYPFIYFMIRDFDIAKSVTAIASYAGLVGSSFMLGRFVGSGPWGIVADRYGRKPVIICGTVSILVFNTAFGFSTTFWMAFLSRFLLGFFNGMLGAIRAYVSEICSEEYQAFGMSLVGTMWGLGLIVGPAIGGYFAQPSIQYPILFPSGSLFDQFPYALPCIFISLFAAVSLVLSFWVPESLHRHPQALVISSVKDYDENIGVENDQDIPKEVHDEKQDNKTKAQKSLLQNWGLVSSISLYCIWSLHDMAYTEIFSLWAESPVKYGGLDMTTSDVGIILAVCGGLLLVFQLFIYSKVQNRLGAIQTARVSMVLSVPLVAIYPLIAKLSGTTLWAMLIAASTLKNVLSASVMTASFILINNSVTSDQRGLANGVSMSAMSLFKAIGPASAGFLLSWAETRMDASFLPGMWMVFSILDILCFITIIATFEPILPRYLNKPKLENLMSKDENIDLQRQASCTYLKT